MNSWFFGLIKAGDSFCRNAGNGYRGLDMVSFKGHSLDEADDGGPGAPAGFWFELA